MNDHGLKSSTERRRCLLMLAALPVCGLSSVPSVASPADKSGAFERAERIGASNKPSVASSTASASSAASARQSLYVPLLWSNGRIPLEHEGRPLPHHPYVIERDNGQRIAATTDAHGWTQPLTADGLEWVTLHVTLPS